MNTQNMPPLSEVQPYVPQQPGMFRSSYVDIKPAPAAQAEIPTWRLPEEATAESRLNSLLSSGSNYIRNARNSGLATMNSRGLLNSSLAAGASQKAAIEAGFPIASQDATSALQGSLAGYQGRINSALNAAKYLNDVSMINSQASASAQLSAQDASQKARTIAVQEGTDSRLSAQDALQRARIIATQEGTDSRLSAQDALQRARIIATQEGTDSRLSAQDASQKKGILATQGGIDSRLSAQDALQKANMIATQEAASSRLSAQDALQKANMIATQEAASSRLSTQEALQKTNAMAAEAAHQAALSKQQAEQSSKAAAEEFAHNIALAEDKATKDQQLEAIQQAGANFRQEQQEIANKNLKLAELASAEQKTFADQALKAGETFETQLVNIQRDPNIPTDAKSVAIEQAQQTYTSVMNNISAIYGSEITWSVPDFTPPAPEPPASEPPPTPPPPPNTQPAKRGYGGGPAPIDWTGGSVG
jgi:hypothetical protein